jgi:N-carbamoyl-L-amino-acid hydrolase
MVGAFTVLGAKTLLTGSHYDTVRNAGKYDGRLALPYPWPGVQALHERGSACHSTSSWWS